MKLMRRMRGSTGRKSGGDEVRASHCGGTRAESTKEKVVHVRASAKDHGEEVDVSIANEEEGVF